MILSILVPDYSGWFPHLDPFWCFNLRMNGIYFMVIGPATLFWIFLFCSNISGSSIRGFLVQELAELSFLQELYASNPKCHTEISFCCHIVMIEAWLLVLLFCRILHGNRLLGILPKELGLLKYLKTLDLGSNELTGPIPPEFGNLTNIVEMYLEFNVHFLKGYLQFGLFWISLTADLLLLMQKSSVEWVVW